MQYTTAFVGSRTEPGRGHGAGITSWRLAPGSMAPLDELRTSNPGYLVIDHSRRILHAAHGDGDSVSSFRISDEGFLEFQSTVRTQGRNPAHLALSPSGKWLLAANHSSGTVVVLPLDSGGIPGEAAHVLALEGEPGPHRTDQQGSKPHQVAFAPDGQRVAVPDKGLDTIFWCSFDDGTGALDPLHAVRLRDGSGPRHVAFHPRHPMMYCINELHSTVTALRLPTDAMEPPVPLQVLPCTAADDVRETRAAEIIVSSCGRLVVASNRSGRGDRAPAGPGHDSLATFAVGEDGTLALANVVDSEGLRPRFVTEYSRWADPGTIAVVVAHEKSDSVRLLLLDAGTGGLVRSQQMMHTGSPTCIAFGPEEPLHPS